MTPFVHPEWTGSVVAATAVAGLGLAFARWQAARRRRRLLAPGVRAGGGAGDLALLVALAAVGVALLGPRLGEREVAVPARGVDVVFLLDVSRSMDARDVPPSRLARARRAVADLLARLEPQDRAALAAFAARGVLLAPLTPDRSALTELLGALDTRLIHPASSNLAAGLEAALEAFEPGGDRPRVVLALSDGEVRLGSAASAAAAAGVRVIAAAIGTDVGGEVPDGGAPLRDADGRIVISRRRAERLERLASTTEGALVLGDAWGALDLERTLAAIRRDAGTAAGETVVRRVRTVQVAPLAGLAFALLLVEALPRRRLRRARRALALAVAACLGLAASPAPREAPGDAALVDLEALLRAQPRDARILVRLGVARLERGHRDAAARAFAAAAVYAREPRLSALAYYDLGVAELGRADLEAARDAFFDALTLAPDDTRARFNLEWTLRALEAQPPEPEPRPREPESRPPEAPDEENVRPEPQPEVPPPTPAQRQRLLDRVTDDPSRALQSWAEQPARRRPAGPAW